MLPPAPATPRPAAAASAGVRHEFSYFDALTGEALTDAEVAGLLPRALDASGAALPATREDDAAGASVALRIEVPSGQGYGLRVEGAGSLRYFGCAVQLPPTQELVRQVRVLLVPRARDVALNYATTRRFTDANDRFLKRVIALDGDVVCALGPRVTINHTIALQRRTVDSVGRALPTWSGCRRLHGQVFLIGDTADSFDGRYWGPVASDLIEGVWRRR